MLASAKALARNLVMEAARREEASRGQLLLAVTRALQILILHLSPKILQQRE
jgi:hypothetical protein